MAPPTSSFVTLVPRRHHRFSPAIFSRPARALHRNGVFDAVPRRTPIASSRPGRVGRLSPDSCRPGRMPMTAVLGHNRSSRPLPDAWEIDVTLNRELPMGRPKSCQLRQHLVVRHEEGSALATAGPGSPAASPCVPVRPVPS